MLSDRERQEVEAQVNRDCAQFEIIMTDIIDAGFDGSNPFLWLHDADGRPWHEAPYKMLTRRYRNVCAAPFPRNLSHLPASAASDDRSLERKILWLQLLMIRNWSPV